MTPVKRQLLKRIAKVATVAFVLVGVILFLAIATPVGFRFEPWRRLPVLDHRMLPHLSAIFAAAFGAFFGSLSAFYRNEAAPIPGNGGANSPNCCPRRACRADCGDI